MVPVIVCEYKSGVILGLHRWNNGGSISGFLVEGRVNSEGKLLLREIPGGMYAVFRYKGSYSDLPEFYKTIYNQWFPYSMYHQKRPLTFEVYLNAPDETPVEELSDGDLYSY